MGSTNQRSKISKLKLVVCNCWKRSTAWSKVLECSLKIWRLGWLDLCLVWWILACWWKWQQTRGVLHRNLRWWLLLCGNYSCIVWFDGKLKEEDNECRGIYSQHGRWNQWLLESRGHFWMWSKICVAGTTSSSAESARQIWRFSSGTTNLQDPWNTQNQHSLFEARRESSGCGRACLVSI